MNNKRIIIAGAPRSGTTSLFNYLNAHPTLYGLKIKETCYFLDQDYFHESFNQTKLLPNFHQFGLKGYDDIFVAASKDQILLDATPDYLYQETFLSALEKFPQKPLVIFCLREPASRLYSLFKFAKSRLGIISNEMSFNELIAGIREKNVLEIQKHKILYHAIEHSKYVNYIDKIVEVIGIENIHIIIQKEFNNNPQKALQLICSKSNIEYSFYHEYEFKAHNESYEVKSQFFRKIYEKLPLPYSFRYGDNRMKMILKKLHHKVNTSENSKKTIKEVTLINSLKEYFHPYNESLRERYGANVTSWH